MTSSCTVAEPRAAARARPEGESFDLRVSTGGPYYLLVLAPDLRPLTLPIEVTPGEDFRVGRPVPLIAPWRLWVAFSRGYDVFPDGSIVTRVAEEDMLDRGSLMAQRLAEFGTTELHVWLNWAEELKERVPN